MAGEEYLRERICDHHRVKTLLEPSDIARFRQALHAAEYDASAVVNRLGQSVMDDAERGDFRKVLAATNDGGAQATLIRVFLCGLSEPRSTIERALDPLSLVAAKSCGLIIGDADGYHAGLALDFYGDSWILADLPASRGGTIARDHVLGTGAAAASLSRYAIRDQVETALDIGTGCGAQALVLSQHARHVTATDVSSRALQFAATNALLNGVEWELLEGDMTAPIAGRRFDQVLSNPPFIVGPGSTEFTYRDSGRSGDGVCAELAAAAPRILNPDGTLQFLANWVHVKGQHWGERVSEWFTDTGCDVWAFQREACDPLDYVRLWQRDADIDHDPQQVAQWLDWFDTNDIEAIGFGVVNAKNSQSANQTVVCEEITQQPAAPFDALIAGWFDTTTQLKNLEPDQLLDSALQLADGVRLDQEAIYGPQGWEVERQLLTDTAGLRRREEIDPLLVSLLGSCNGSVPFRTQVALLAQAHEAPEALLAASLIPVVQRLISHGFLRVM